MSRNVREITTDCDNIYIPPFIFRTIVATKLSLINPVLDEDILKSIPCYSVYLETDYKSFGSLQCSIFGLKTKLVNNVLPIMPKHAYNVTWKFSHNTETILLSNNTTIRWLTLGEGTNMHLENMSLVSLIVDGRNSTISLDNNTLIQLEELVVFSKECNFIERDDRIYITKMEGDLYNGELLNMLVFQGNLTHDKQYLLMPNLKKLTLSDKFLDTKYIPDKLEEYIVDSTYMGADNIDEIKRIESYLFNMPSIRRMPLILNSNHQADIPFEDRYNVYYDIYIYKNDILSKRDFPSPRIDKVLIHNKRYLDKNKTLESFY